MLATFACLSFSNAHHIASTISFSSKFSDSHFPFSLSFLVLSLQGGGSSAKHLRRSLYLEREEKGYRHLQGLDYVGEVLAPLVYQAFSDGDASLQVDEADSLAPSIPTTYAGAQAAAAVLSAATPRLE
jgi:hypothetical protein